MPWWRLGPAALALALASCQLVFSLDGQSCPLQPADCGTTGPDEDEDGERDACDSCPQFAGELGDRDGDGIGDPCDPAPDLAPVCAGRWFFDLSSPGGLRDTSRWTLDEAAFPATPAVASELVTLVTEERHGAGRVETHVDDGSPIDRSEQVFTGVVVLDADDAGYACGIRQAAGGAVGTLLLLELEGGTERVLDETATTFAVTPGLSHRIILDLRSDGTLACSSLEGLSVDGRLDGTYRRRAFHVGIGARASDAGYRYLDFIPE